ncbi:MAG: hypothetical protein H7338_04260 [Candidatus Sericytochromatia bacterium]|nr:hypothetical protein [Candidatus Sericytochromatia bacterium]
MLRPSAVLQGLQLDLSLPADLRLVVADRERTLQVLSNLIGNAIKFTPAGGTISVRVMGQGAVVCVSVRDTGSGIPADRQALVFDRFWQAEKSRRQGAGLGLAISKGIVEAQGGTIWVESMVGAGSTFSFTLPVAEGP